MATGSHRAPSGQPALPGVHFKPAVAERRLQLAPQVQCGDSYPGDSSDIIVTQVPPLKLQFLPTNVWSPFA